VTDKRHNFVFEIDRAIRTQVIEKLEAIHELELNEAVGPPVKGVYVLYWKGSLFTRARPLTPR